MAKVEIPRSVIQQGQRLQKALAKVAEAAKTNREDLIKLYDTFRSRIQQETESHDEAVRTAASNLRTWMEETLQEYSTTDDPYNSPWDEAYAVTEEIRGIDAEDAVYELPSAEDVFRLRLEDLSIALESLPATWDDED